MAINDRSLINFFQAVHHVQLQGMVLSHVIAILYRIWDDVILIVTQATYYSVLAGINALMASGLMLCRLANVSEPAENLQYESG